MRNLLPVALAAAFAVTPAIAQTPPPGSSKTEVLGNPGDIGIMATTPSRIGNSRREMNRGRMTPFRMSERETRQYARDVLERANIRCDVEDAIEVARTREGEPVVEIHCSEGSGLVIIDTDPIQASGCLDLEPIDGAPAENYSNLQGCRLPANVAAIEAARQAARN
jgi:hypothetical protein